MEEAELDAETRSNLAKKDTDEDDVPSEKETEQDIIARASALAKQSSPPATADEPVFSFPSLPTHIPVDESENDEEATAKMALLLGLSRPTTNPGPRLPSPPKDRKPGQGWNLPGYKDDNDEDPDSWCCTSLPLLSEQKMSGKRADGQVYVIKTQRLFVSVVTGTRIVRNVGSRAMSGRDTGRRGSLRGVGGRLLVLESAWYHGL